MLCQKKQALKEKDMGERTLNVKDKEPLSRKERAEKNMQETPL